MVDWWIMLRQLTFIKQLTNLKKPNNKSDSIIKVKWVMLSLEKPLHIKFRLQIMIVLIVTIIVEIQDLILT